MFEYSQSTGILTRDGATLGVGYSGNGAGLNSPAHQGVKGMGPVPQGLYTIAPPHADEHVGPIAMRLIPAAGNEMYGRGEFLIHGPHANDHHDSSEGCIILQHDDRIQVGRIVLAGDNQLTVVA